MAGFTPDEAEVLIGTVLLQKDLTNRIADLELGLFTNTAPDETITHATITEPTGTGYARITLTDASWVPTGSVFAYAQQTFTAGGNWTGTVKGYFVCTKGASKKLLAVELDPGGPYTMNTGDTYKVTPSLTFS